MSIHEALNAKRSSEVLEKLRIVQRDDTNVLGAIQAAIPRVNIRTQAQYIIRAHFITIERVDAFRLEFQIPDIAQLHELF